MTNVGLMKHPDEQMTTAEAAEALGWSVRKLNRYAKDGRVRPYKQLAGTYGARIYMRSEIERIKALYCTPKSEAA